MEILKKYAAHSDEFVRAVALDAIGMLGPESELAFLKERYAALTGMDKFMALKAIGDAGDEESLKFVRDQSSIPLYEHEAGLKYLVDLYGGK
jgi:HEAT repeat protein